MCLYVLQREIYIERERERCFARVKDHQKLLSNSPLVQNACVRQVVLNKWKEAVEVNPRRPRGDVDTLQL